MPPKIHTIFSQELDNGTEVEFGVGEDQQAYWNGKPIVTQEKVVLQHWVNVALIVTAVAVIGQAVFAGLSYRAMTAQQTAADSTKDAAVDHWKLVAQKAYTEAFIAKHGNGKGIVIPKGTSLVSPDGGKTFLISPPDTY